MKKLLVLIACSMASAAITSHADAASFEDMVAHVENGEGVIYNPVSKGLMTKENSIEYVEIVKEKVVAIEGEIGNKLENITGDELENILEEAYVETKDAETIPGTKVNTPSNMTRGANPPSYSSVLYIDELPTQSYTSESFSGSGWRYSGYYFAFRDFVNNPYFGVAASGDSFDFRDAYGGYNAVYPVGYYTYFPSYVRGGGSNSLGLFRTFNPISGSKYYIY